MSYDNTNSGVLFHNDRKRDGKKDPDYTGSATIGVEFDCPHCKKPVKTTVEYWQSGWINESRQGGKKRLAQKFRVKDKPPADNPSDEIPF